MVAAVNYSQPVAYKLVSIQYSQNESTSKHQIQTNTFISQLLREKKIYFSLIAADCNSWYPIIATSINHALLQHDNNT